MNTRTSVKREGNGVWGGQCYCPMTRKKYWVGVAKAKSCGKLKCHYGRKMNCYRNTNKKYRYSVTCGRRTTQWYTFTKVQQNKMVNDLIKRENIGNALMKKVGEYQWKKLGTRRQNAQINAEIKKRAAAQAKKQMERRRKSVAAN